MLLMRLLFHVQVYGLQVAIDSIYGLVMVAMKCLLGSTLEIVLT